MKDTFLHCNLSYLFLKYSLFYQPRGVYVCPSVRAAPARATATPKQQVMN
jgi:hypothetical protein